MLSQTLVPAKNKIIISLMLILQVFLSSMSSLFHSAHSYPASREMPLWTIQDTGSLQTRTPTSKSSASSQLSKTPSSSSTRSIAKQQFDLGYLKTQYPKSGLLQRSQYESFGDDSVFSMSLKLATTGGEKRLTATVQWSWRPESSLWTVFAFRLEYALFGQIDPTSGISTEELSILRSVPPTTRFAETSEDDQQGHFRGKQGTKDPTKFHYFRISQISRGGSHAQANVTMTTRRPQHERSWWCSDCSGFDCQQTIQRPYVVPALLLELRVTGGIE